MKNKNSQQRYFTADMKECQICKISIPKIKNNNKSTDEIKRTTHSRTSGCNLVEKPLSVFYSLKQIFRIPRYKIVLPSIFQSLTLRRTVK